MGVLLDVYKVQAPPKCINITVGVGHLRSRVAQLLFVGHILCKSMMPRTNAELGAPFFQPVIK